MNTVLKSLCQPQYLFILLAIIFGLALVKMVPPLWGTDETAHFARSYQLAHGEIAPPRNANGAYGGPVPRNFVTLWDYTKNDLLDNTTTGILSRKDVDNSYRYSQLTNRSFSKEEQTSPGSAIYSPVSYIAPTLGVVIANILHEPIGNTIFLARFCSLLFYIALIYLAIRLLQYSRLKWLIFTVALLPTSMYQASVVTADTMTIGLSLLFMSIFIRLANKVNDREKIKKQLFYGLVAVSTLLTLVKINYVFLGLAIVLVPNKIFRSEKIAASYKTIGILLMTILGAISYKVSQATNSANVSQRPDGAKIIPSDQMALVIHYPLHFLAACTRSVIDMGDYYYRTMLALIGWNYVDIPLGFIVLLSLGIIFAAFYAREELAKMRQKLIFLNILVLGGIVSTFGALYIAFTPTGSGIVEGIQGRYFIPFIVPIAMLIGSSIPVEVKIRDKLTPYVFGSISAICLFVSVLYYYFITY